MLSFGQRMALAVLLDNRVPGNWQDIGRKIAGRDDHLLSLIIACHQCYYGGGKQMYPVFKYLSQRKPDLTVDDFNTISSKLNRTDVVAYIKDNKLLSGKLADMPNGHLGKIGDLLDKRVDIGKGHYWPSFADEFELKCDEIEDFRNGLQKPQKYSPTYEMISILEKNIPDLTIERFRDVALSFEQPDKVKKLLRGIIESFKTWIIRCMWFRWMWFRWMWFRWMWFRFGYWSSSDQNKSVK